MLKIYDNESKAENGNISSFFYGITRDNEDKSKSCCGYYQSGIDIMTFYSDVSAKGERTFKINDYGGILSGKILFGVNDPVALINEMVALVNRCSTMKDEDIKRELSSIFGVRPEYVIEKFNAPDEVFARLKAGETLDAIVGPAQNFIHDATAIDQEPIISKNTSEKRAM